MDNDENFFFSLTKFHIFFVVVVVYEIWSTARQMNEWTTTTKKNSAITIQIECDYGACFEHGQT